MIIGTFGEITFEVSNNKVFTLSGFKRDTKSKFATHETIGNPPKLEFLHKELQTISFEIILHQSLGIDPAAETQKLRELCETGESNFLVIGNEVFGDDQWIIESVSENVSVWTPDGKIYATKLDLTLQEYFSEAD